jgi:outer membrane protein TolC
MSRLNKLKALLGLEKAEHKVVQAEEALASVKSDMRSAIISSIVLDPTSDEIDSLKAQIATAIILVVQADKIVKSTQAIVSNAREAVEIARQMHVTANKKEED